MNSMTRKVTLLTTLLALALADGREQGRIQSEHGFQAAPSLSEGRGFILGNAGVFYAFDYN